jgi:DNA-binding transcriptional regulator YhcF (GntR family)
MFDQLLLGRWPPGNKIPGIRQLGGVLNVNPATVALAYRQWHEMAILRRRRGMGYWVMPDGLERARRLLAADFTEKKLPHFFGNIQLLGIPWAEVELAYQKYVSGLCAGAIKNKLC